MAGKVLADDGFDAAADPLTTDLLMVDTDHPDAPPRPHKHELVKELLRRGVPVGLYPHGGLPILDYDGWRKPLPLAFELVHGEGHKQVYEKIGLKRRVEAVGWSYSDVVPKSDGPIDHVVFAPIHPWWDGKTILPFHRTLNEVAYRAFLEFPCDRKTVRLFGDDDPNGIFERVDGVDYQESDLSLGLDLIDSSDAVVSYGTFACTALARGKRTVMIYPYPAHTDDYGRKAAERFDEYSELCRYPANVSEAPLGDLFRVDTSDWERLFIGGPLDVEKVAWVFAQYRPNRAQRRKMARR